MYELLNNLDLWFEISPIWAGIKGAMIVLVMFAALIYFLRYFYFKVREFFSALLIVTLFFFSGCTSVSTVEFTKFGVVIKHGSQEAIKYTDGTRTVEYDGRRDSLVRTLTEAAALREVNRR
jgi:hypothetical protein